MARLTKHDWLEAEELYRQGWTQKQIAAKFKCRPETVSLHMNKQKVKGGESIDVVRQELEAAVTRKVKEFAEKRAGRQIDTKERLHTLANTMLSLFVKEVKAAQTAGASLDKLAGQARSLKDAMQALKLVREELYTILEIREELNTDENPDLFIMTMSKEEEDRIRGAGGTLDEDDMDEALEVIEENNLEDEVEGETDGE